MMSEFIRQCPVCQITNRSRILIKTHPFTCASYNPFEVLHLDHIDPLTKDAHGNEYILIIIDAFSRWVELFPTKTTTAIETASVILNHIGRFGSPEVIHTDRCPAFHMNLSLNSYNLAVFNNHLLLHTQARRTVSWNVPIKKYYDTYVLYSSIAVSAISGNLSSFHLFSVS